MDLAPITRALLFAAEHYQEQPSLEALARVAGLSPTHFQRRFQAAVGLSPKRFVAQLSARQAAAALRGGRNVLDAALDAGLSGPGRLHDLMVSVEGATPGELASGGEGLVLRTGLVPTPCGPLYGAVATRGLCWAAFADGPAALREAQRGLERLWPRAKPFSSRSGGPWCACPRAARSATRRSAKPRACAGPGPLAAPWRAIPWPSSSPATA
jgi:AraC family transcriptional regulator of adaptative response/methylated-DNA-[protein]-cysteine methyltransferase